jgi:hypothetical protein
MSALYNSVLGYFYLTFKKLISLYITQLKTVLINLINLGLSD